MVRADSMALLAINIVLHVRTSFCVCDGNRGVIGKPSGYQLVWCCMWMINTGCH